MGAHMPSCKCVRLRRLQSGRRPHYLARMATAALLLSAGGVTASKIPYVLAVTAQYHLGARARFPHVCHLNGARARARGWLLPEAAVAGAGGRIARPLLHWHGHIDAWRNARVVCGVVRAGRRAQAPVLRFRSAIRISQHNVHGIDKPGATVACSVCLRSYHLSSARRARAWSRLRAREGGHHIGLACFCGTRSGTAGSNRVAP